MTSRTVLSLTQNRRTLVAVLAIGVVALASALGMWRAYHEGGRMGHGRQVGSHR
jgi:membrane protein DedA with SNARE-associated domain